MKAKDRRRQPWKQPNEIQGYPNAGGRRVQIRFPDGRCTIKRAGQVEWNAITEWRWA